jgi:drug/metabolite transporter superfamily protein YnfA
MGSEEYFSFFLSGLVEIPGYLFCWAVMDRWGRRWPLCMLMVVGGLFCVATVLMPAGLCPFTSSWENNIETLK